MLLEVASVLAIIGSAVAIAIPKAEEVQTGRTATQLSEDIATVQTAVLAFYSDSAYFPPEGILGDIPVSLEQYLPGSFSFRRAYGTLEYRNWPARVPVQPVSDSLARRAGADSVGADTAPVLALPIDSGLAAIAPMITRPGIRVPTAPGIPSAAAAAATAAPNRSDERIAGDSASVGRVIGIRVTTRDPRVGAIAAQRARRMARFIVGDNVTFVLFGA